MIITICLQHSNALTDNTRIFLAYDFIRKIRMKTTSSIGLKLVAAAIMMASCTQENVILDSSPVTNHQVSISFFEHSTEDIGDSPSDDTPSTARAYTGSRADTQKSLQDCKIFSELVVSLIPTTEGLTETYVVNQDSLDDNFGHVGLDVPAGTYHMVAVAGRSVMPITTPISIVSASEVRFPNDQVTDMVYAYQDITVRSDQSSQSISAGMQRGISAFELESTEFTPAKAAVVDLKITGNCGVVLNPATGKCKENSAVTRRIEFDGAKYQYKRPRFYIYAFLGEDDVSDLQVDAVVKDKDGKVMRNLHFENVHLEKGRVTRYSGKVFTKSDNIDFIVTYPTMEESKYSQTF